MVNYKLKQSFGKISEMYDVVRPDYPTELIDDVISISRIKPNGRILEIGCGTGKATIPFVKKSYQITALDISKSQISIAKRHLSDFSNVEFIISSFEKADLPNNYYDLVFSAQTFHWIDPFVGYEKVHNVLRNDGYIALFSNFQYSQASLEKEIRKLYMKYCPDFPKEYGTLNHLQKQFEESELFQNIKRKTYMRDLKYTKEEYLNLLNSFSWISTLKYTKKDEFFSEVNILLGKLGESLVVPTQSILFTGGKKKKIKLFNKLFK